MDSVTHERRILLSGPLNFRDLGGYATSDGRVVRWRRVFRSDSLRRVSDADVSHLVDELGLLTVIDLRTPEEVATFGRGTLERSALAYHQVPILDETQLADPGIVPGPSLHDMYLVMLRGSGARVAEVLHILAEADGHPAVFHCAAGKDRTGVVAAVLLGLLGVGEDDILADYALTAEIMPRMLERFHAHAEALGETRQFPPHLVGAEPETMRQVLDAVHDEYGSLVGYAAAWGVTEAVVDDLRSALVTGGDTVGD